MASNFETKEYGIRHKKVIFLMGGWTYRMFMLRPVAAILTLRGYHSISYCYDVAVLSPDYRKTVHDLLEIKGDVLERIGQLKAKGKTDFSILGTSLGSTLAVLVANESKDVDRVILNTTGPDMAKAVWGWDIVKPSFKQGLLNNNITLQQLAKEWKPISAIYNIDKFKDKKVLVYLSTRDRLIPYKQGRELVKRFRDNGVECELVVNRHLGHTMTGYYNLIRAKRYIRFLEQ